MRLLALAALALCAASPAALAQVDGRVLVYSRTEGFRHGSIASGISAMQDLASEHGFTVTATETPGSFTPEGLAAYDAVVFLNTTGDVLDASQQSAFEDYIRQGGGWMGIHSAADTEYEWSFYGGMVGAYFQSHPPGAPRATVNVVDRVHPSTDHLPASWGRADEWYNYQSNPRGNVHVLATLDEQTYDGGNMLGDHPIAWCHDYAGGRAFYTGGGHTEASFSEPLFREHLWGGLAWAAGWAPGNCSATVETSWERTVLEADVTDGMELAVATDGRVFFVERGGAVRVWSPETQSTRTVANLPVTTSFEDGLLGITLDPEFTTNGWIYLYYSIAGGQPIQRLSRFTLEGSTLNLDSEAVLLTVPTDRSTGGHSGGSIAFGPDGTLYIATGDDVEPFDSNGYTPIDERPGRSGFDAQFTSGNPYNLRGKILRIRPLADGTAEIPEGNLFAPDGSEGRPEIYAMGLRNPFRISLDPETGWLYWGDVGPDAGADDGSRGPRGYDEFNQARQPGFFGWPYCIADNIPYRDYNFETGATGGLFNCAAAVNDSPNVMQAPFSLPPAQPAWAWYPYAPSPEFPDIPFGGGRTAMAGPVVRAEALPESNLPAYFDGSVFFYEWSRNWIVETHLDANGRPLEFQRFLPSLELNRPIDLELGADGALYMLEWGAGFGGGNPEAALSRIAYVRGSRAPVAQVQASETNGPAPLAVDFTSSGTFHPDGLTLTYAWDFDADGVTDATTPSASYTYTENGSYLARLTVQDTDGLTATATVSVVVGNTRPVVTVLGPPAGGFFTWGDSLSYSVRVDDLEDGSTDGGAIDCADVTTQPGIGHDDHNHPLEEYAGCEGGFRTPDGHGADGENVFIVLESRYVDGGALGVGSLVGRRQVVLRPSKLEAEHFSDQRGVQFEATGDESGVLNAGFIDDNDWLAYTPVSLQGIDFVTYRVASAGAGGRIEMRLDSPTGTLVSTAYITPTGGWQTYKDISVPVDAPDDDTHTLYLVFRNPGGSGGLFNINWMKFHGPGVAVVLDAPRGLEAEYFPTPDLAGTPVMRTDPQISFEWGTRSPAGDVPRNNFSVRWRGELKVPASGRYRFTLRTDDGSRLRIDGETIIDSWEESGFSSTSGSARLAEGTVPIEIEYREATGDAQANLLWSGPGRPLRTIESEFFQASFAVFTEPTASPSLRLAPPRPNPSRDEATFAFSLPASEETSLNVFDALGREVLRLQDGRLQAGEHEIQADLSALPSGVYIVRLAVDGAMEAQRLTVMR